MKELGQLCLREIEDRRSLISAHGVVASGGWGDVTGSQTWLVVKNRQLAPSSFSLLLSQLSRLGVGKEGMTRLWAFSWAEMTKPWKDQNQNTALISTCLCSFVLVSQRLTFRALSRHRGRECCSYPVHPQAIVSVSEKSQHRISGPGSFSQFLYNSFSFKKMKELRELGRTNEHMKMQTRHPTMSGAPCWGRGCDGPGQTLRASVWALIKQTSSRVPGHQWVVAYSVFISGPIRTFPFSGIPLLGLS